MNVFAVLLAASLVSAAAPVFTAKTVDGRQVLGTLGDWDETAVTLRDGERLQRVPLDQLLSVVPGKTGTSAAPIECDVFQMANLRPRSLGENQWVRLRAHGGNPIP